MLRVSLRKVGDIEAGFGYKAVAWQEANESTEALVVRNVIMYTVVAAIMLVAGFGIFNIISTITHEKARDIAIISRDCERGNSVNPT